MTIAPSIRPTRPDALLVLLFLLAFCHGCDREPLPESSRSNPPNASAWFENVTEDAGLHFIHQVTLTGHYLISEQMGSGAALFDYDNDGRLDVYLIHNVAPSSPATHRLFHQESDGRFQDVSPESGLDVAGYANGLAVGDVNNDGWLDLFLTEYDRIRLFLNQEGSGKFTDITSAAGLSNAVWSVPAAFLDYDRDGWLDLVVGNYLDFDPTQQCTDPKGAPDFCGPHGFPATVTRLFHNITGRTVAHPTSPRFEDVTATSGLARWPGKAMGMVCADFNGDRWPDIFITDDGMPNRLFINQHDGTFTEQAVARGLAYTGLGATASNMGIALGDIDGNGLFDVFVPHLAEENHTLWAQNPVGVFLDKTASAGFMKLPWHGTGFAPVLADFDRDGALDLAIANGLVRRRLGQIPVSPAPGLDPFWVPYAELNQLFANDGRGQYQEVSDMNPAFCGEALVGRGLACGDIDNDGALDLLLSGIGGPARLYRNVASPRGHWIGIRAVDPNLGGRDAYGAEVRVQAGNQRWMRLVQPGYSYCSSNDPRVHFGLGQTRQLDRIEILWPDGTEELFTGIAPDQYVQLIKGSGRKITLEAR